MKKFKNIFVRDYPSITQIKDIKDIKDIKIEASLTNNLQNMLLAAIDFPTTFATIVFEKQFDTSLCCCFELSNKVIKFHIPQEGDYRG